MDCTFESKQEAVVKSFLQTTEKSVGLTKGTIQPVISQASKQVNAEVYFQIED